MPYLGPRCCNINEFIHDIKVAEEIGCDSLYFSLRPATNMVGYQEGATYWDQLMEPWRIALESTKLPVMIYNHSGPLASKEPNIPLNKMVEIAKDYNNVAGIKTNSPLSGQLAGEIYELKPLGLSIAKGLHEFEFIGSLSMGVDGFICITGHALPDFIDELYRSFLSGNFPRAQEILWHIYPIMNVIS